MKEKFEAREILYGRRVLYQLFFFGEGRELKNLLVVERMSFNNYELVRMEEDGELREVLMDVPNVFVKVEDNTKQRLEYFLIRHRKQVFDKFTEDFIKEGYQISERYYLIEGSQMAMVQNIETGQSEIVELKEHRNTGVFLEKDMFFREKEMKAKEYFKI